MTAPDTPGETDEVGSIMDLARQLPHLALVETSAALPGLLPAVAWQAVHEAVVVLAVEPSTHPAVAGLASVGLEVAALEPAAGEPIVGRNLMTAPPTAGDALARGALQAARDHGDVALLLPPDDTELGRAIGLAAARDADVEVEYVFLVGAPRGLELLDLVTVVDALLDPEDGCPWDLEQTHESLGAHLVEETYEALDAIAAGDDDAMAEELGDVLMQVVFHARLAQGRNAFDIDRIAGGIAEKLRRRHPHVFGDVEVADAAEVRRNWDAIKAEEKPERDSPFDGVARSLPSLPLAHEVLSRAAKLGWSPDRARATTTVAAAVAELVSLVDDLDPATADPEVADAVEEAFGDVALGLVGLARSLDRDADVLLRARVHRFVDRVEEARRRAARRGTEPGSTAAWQALIDEVAAAGW